MIKRLIDIARANLNHFGNKRPEEKSSTDSIPESPFGFDESESRRARQPEQAEDALAQYYANLEISPGSDREAVKSAWKRMMKKISSGPARQRSRNTENRQGVDPAVDGKLSNFRQKTT